MVNEKNINLIENKKTQVEEVREIDYKVPSFEEFMKGYEENEKMNNSYENEFDSYRDIRVNRSYGPGNTQSVEEYRDESKRLSKYMGKKLIAKGASLAIGPLAIPVGSTLKQASRAMSGDPSFFMEMLDPLEPISEKQQQTEFEKWMDELGGELIEGGIGGELIGELIHDIAFQVDSELAKKFWNIIGKTHEAYGEGGDMTDFAIIKHFSHINNGNKYDSDCAVCKE